MLEKFEQQRIFVVVRVLSFVGIAVLSIFVLASSILWSGSLLPTGTRVTPTQVAQTLLPPNSVRPAGPGSEAILANVNLPSGVRKYLMSDEDYKSVLEGWLRELDPDLRQDFLDNMEEVIRYAEQNNLDVTKAVDTYQSLKVQKYQVAGSKALDAKISRYGILGSMVAAVMLIVALSLVLVVLAIERNTRPQNSRSTVPIPPHKV